MSNVLALFPVRREPRRPPSLPSRVRVFSRVLSFGFLGLALLSTTVVVTVLATMVLLPGGMVGLGPHGGWFDTSGHMPSDYTALGDLPTREKLTYLLVAVVREGPKLAILLNQAALFRLYAQGEVFQPANARRLRDTGAWLVVDGVSPLLCHVALSVAGWRSTGAGPTSVACRRERWDCSCSLSPRSWLSGARSKTTARGSSDAHHRAVGRHAGAA